MLVDEVDAYGSSGLPTARPNSMNKYGLVMNEIGMEPVFDSLQATVLQPIAQLLFPTEGGSLDRHHSFVVQYEMGKDLGLDMHTDNSDVTFNVCLGRDFDGAGLTFCGHMGHAEHRHFSYRHKHVKGHCIVHLGRRRHGADEITRGERLNLIIWNTNLAFRSSQSFNDLQRQHRYERESGPPDGVCLSYTHDRDFLKYKETPRAHAKMTRRAWCPPRFAAHDAPDTQPAAARGDHAARRAARLRTDLVSDEEEDDDADHDEEEEFAQLAKGAPATDADAAELQQVIRGVLGGGTGPTSPVSITLPAHPPPAPPTSSPPPPEYDMSREEEAAMLPIDQALEEMLARDRGTLL